MTSPLDLIDWRLVGSSALWLLGLSVLLAALSFADYRAGQEGVRARAVLARPAYDAGLHLGVFLFGLGMLVRDQALWERLLWAGLAALAAAGLARAWRGWRSGRALEPQTGQRA